MDAKQLPHRFYTSFRSKEGAVEKLQGICDEQRRTQKELANPNADLRCGKARTYGRRSTALDRCCSQDKLRLMQRPRLRMMVSAAAAAEFEHWKLREEEDNGKGRE